MRYAGKGDGNVKSLSVPRRALLLPLPAFLLFCLLLMLNATFATAQKPKYKRTPPPPRVQPLQLKTPFTLTYKAAVDSLLYKQKQHSNLRLTLSYDGTRLLYRSEDLKTHVTRTILYDGFETYTMDSNSRLAKIEPGFDFDRLLFCMLPGVGLPKQPFMTDGFRPVDVPQLPRAFAAKLKSEQQFVSPALYSTPGQQRDFGGLATYDPITHTGQRGASACTVVSVAEAGLTKVLWYDTLDNVSASPGNLWEFFSHQRFQGVWLAKKIRIRFFTTDPQTRKNNLQRDVHYELEKAASSALAAKAYDPVTYLPHHANITDMTGPRLRAFLYEPGNGPLAAQRAKQ